MKPTPAQWSVAELPRCSPKMAMRSAATKYSGSSASTRDRSWLGEAAGVHVHTCEHQPRLEDWEHQ